MSSEAKRASLLPPDGTFMFVKAVLTVIVPASPPPLRVLIVTWLLFSKLEIMEDAAIVAEVV